MITTGNHALLAWIATFVAAVFGGCAGGAATGPRPRHVLLISIDTLRADVLGSYGDSRSSTSTLDGLAADGVRFTAAIAPAPLTLPSHAAMLTGTNPWRLGIRHNGIYRLEPRFTSLAEHLEAAGFETAAVVAGYPLSEFSGLDQGFIVYDDAIPLEAGELYHNPERGAEEVTDAALAWLDSRPDPSHPFFLFVHYYDPHAPYEPPQPYRPTGPPGSPEESLDAYRGEVAYVDDQISRLVDRLGRDGLLDDTLVVVTADHGEGLMEHGELTHGIFLYDDVVRVPLIMRFPKRIDGGTVIDDVVGLVDVTPTILDALGLPPQAGSDGRSVWRLATKRGGEPRRGEVYAESQYPRLEHGWAPLRAVRTPDWKYVDAPDPELYRLPDDREERDNVIAAHPEVARRLHAGLQRAFLEASEGDRVEISEEEIERLRSLGYLQGSAGQTPGAGDAPDPKAMISQYAQLRRASGEMMEGRYRDAEMRLAALVESDPGNVSARCRLADARLVQNDLPGAEQALLDALEIAQGAGQAAVLWRLAGLERRRGRHDLALSYYRRYSEIAPLSARTIERMAGTLSEAGRVDEAEALLEDWLTDHPGSLIALQALARLRDASDRSDEAADLWRRVLGLRPDDPEAKAALSGS